MSTFKLKKGNEAIIEVFMRENEDWKGECKYLYCTNKDATIYAATSSSWTILESAYCEECAEYVKKKLNDWGAYDYFRELSNRYFNKRDRSSDPVMEMIRSYTNNTHMTWDIPASIGESLQSINILIND